MPVFRRDYPDVILDVSVDDAFVDLAADGYDAGIQPGESVAKDMVALRLTFQAEDRPFGGLLAGSKL